MKKALLFLSAFSFLHIHSQAPVFSWASQLGGGADEEAHGIAVDAAGNVYTIGYFKATIDADPGPANLPFTSAGDDDIFLVKQNASGTLVWAKQLGGAGQDWGTAIAVDGAGSVYITGRFTGTVDFDPNAGTANLTSFGDADAFICKYNTSGNIVYAKQVGGTGLDSGYGIVLDADGNVITVGNFYMYADFDPGSASYMLSGQSCDNMFACKLNAEGQFVWAKNTSGPSEAHGVTVDGQMNVIVTGMFYGTIDFDPNAGIANMTSTGSSTTSDIHIWKLDPSGNLLWAKQMGGTSTGGIDCGNAVTTDKFGNIYSTGFFLYTGDFDPGPGTYSMTAQNYDAYIMQLDANGNFGWAKQVSGVSAQRGFGIDLDEDGDVYVTGDFIDVTDLDPGSGTLSAGTLGSGNMPFLLHLDASGNFIWATPIDAGGTGNAIVIADDYSICSAGRFYTYTNDFDPGAAVFSFNGAGGYDAYVHKMAQPTAGIEENEVNNHLQVYPNPTSGYLHIVSDVPVPQLVLTNNLGQTVMQGNTNMLDLRMLPAGVYYVQVGGTVRKIILQ